MFDASGVLWFTVQNGNFVGRLYPRTGRIDLKPSPTPDSRPYGIAATPDGSVLYSESGAGPNRIVRFHPGTETFDACDVPSGSGVIRHMVAAPGGEVSIACSGVNKVGIVKAGQ
jgi:virginiamycin B lyase